MQHKLKKKKKGGAVYERRMKYEDEKGGRTDRQTEGGGQL